MAIRCASRKTGAHHFDRGRWRRAWLRRRRTAM